MTANRYVEIRGTEFINKGAELMMHAIIDSLPSGWVPVIEPSRKNPRRSLELVGVLGKRSRGLNGIGRKGEIPESEISVVLDASGFAYSDKWGVSRTHRRLGAHVDRWRSQGKKVILLPQAFGPFEDSALRSQMRYVLDHVDLVFARDPTSREHLDSINSSARIESAPDFTNLLQGIVPDRVEDWSRRVPVIPNRRMVESSERTYVEDLVGTIHSIRAAGYDPILLVHEIGRDINLAKRIARSVSPTVPVVVEADARNIKGIIGASAAVVTSRFHGLVSALSQGTPCLATSWSHKYQHLVDEYGADETVVRRTSELPDRTRALLTNSALDQMRSQLKRRAPEIEARTVAMWEKVFECAS